MKKIKLFLATLLLTLSMSITAFASEWKQDTTGWWYQNDDGTYPANGFEKIDYYWYYFDETGYMKTGWLQTSDGWYGFHDNGHCINPIYYYTLENATPIAGPYEGWCEISAGYEALIEGLANGSIVSYNGRYWYDSNVVYNETVYQKDVSPNPNIKIDRFGLADMQF